MGPRRKRLIVQADLTSEEDQAFLEWVKAKLRRRRLAEEIREGLRLQYARSSGQVKSAYADYPRELDQTDQTERQDLNQRELAGSAANRVRMLVQNF